MIFRPFGCCVLFGAFAFVSTLGTASAALPTPLVRYSFDEASTGTAPAADTGVAPQASGAFVNSTRTANTPAGSSVGALDLSTAGNRYVTTSAANSKTDNKQALTVTAWVNLQGTPAEDDMIVSDIASDFGTGIRGGWAWRFIPPVNSSPASANNISMSLKLGAYTSSGGQTWYFNSQPITNAGNRWAFLAMTYQEGFDGSASFYSGGVLTAATLVSQHNISSGVFHNSNSTDLRIGGDTGQPATDHTPPAWIDDVRVYDGVLTLAQLNEIRAQNVPEPSGAATVIVALLLLAGRKRSLRG